MLKKLICRAAALVLVLTVSTPALQAAAAVNPHRITKDDMIYFIMTDRFYDGDTSNDKDVNRDDPSAYHGGDFQGVIDKLDYIKSLGFTTIWITPVVQNQAGGYHGYWATDFYKTDSHLGSIGKLKELVKKAHSKDMKVIVDLVVNHTGQQHPWVSDPAFRGWFHEQADISDYNDQDEVENGWLAGLPDLDQGNPKVAKYLTDMALWWIKETGIDGYRLDTMKHVPISFWQKFIGAVKKNYPDFYTIGEVYDGDVNFLSKYQSTGVDGLLDFPIYYAVNDVFKNGSPEAKLEVAIDNSGALKNRSLMGTFIDNHDVERFSNNLGEFKDQKLKQALTFLLTYTGIPIMYYGTEIGMEGGADPDNRRDMDWGAKSAVTDYLKRLTSIRKSNRELTDGDIKVFGEDPDILSYSRIRGGSSIIVVFNMLDRDKDVAIKIPGDENSGSEKLKSLLGDDRFEIKGGQATFRMAPYDVRIFSLKGGAAARGREKAVYAVVSAAIILGVSAAAYAYILKKRKNRG